MVDPDVTCKWSYKPFNGIRSNVTLHTIDNVLMIEDFTSTKHEGQYIAHVDGLPCISLHVYCKYKIIFQIYFLTYYS